MKNYSENEIKAMETIVDMVKNTTDGISPKIKMSDTLLNETQFDELFKKLVADGFITYKGKSKESYDWVKVEQILIEAIKAIKE